MVDSQSLILYVETVEFEPPGSDSEEEEEEEEEGSEDEGMQIKISCVIIFTVCGKGVISQYLRM